MPPLRRDFDLAGVRAAKAEFLTFSVPFLRRRPLFGELFTRNFIFLVRKNNSFCTRSPTLVMFTVNAQLADGMA